MTGKQETDTRKTRALGSTSSAGTTKSKQALVEAVAASQIAGVEASLEQRLIWLESLVQAPISTEAEAEVIRGILRETSRRADMTSRIEVFTTLLHFYPHGIAQDVWKSMLKLYLAEVVDYPDWAVSKAVAWWLSRDNPKSGYRPTPGQISGRAHELTEGMRAAQKRLQNWMMK